MQGAARAGRPADRWGGGAEREEARRVGAAGARTLTVRSSPPVATVAAHWRTGVEMEALTCVQAALLTVYDMLKAVDRSMSIEGVRLLEKRGGSSGDWRRD